MSSPPTWVDTILTAVSRAGSIVCIRWPTSVVLPAPMSPVMTLKPSPCAKP